MFSTARPAEKDRKVKGSGGSTDEGLKTEKTRQQRRKTIQVSCELLGGVRHQTGGELETLQAKQKTVVRFCWFEDIAVDSNGKNSGTKSRSEITAR